MDVTFRPLGAFPADFHTTREWGDRFRATWGDTLDKLKSELSKLGASSVVIEIALQEGDIRRDGWPRANARPSHPGVVISFDSKHGPLRYGTDKFPRWEANVRALALGLESLRRVERYGIGRRGEQYQGWRQLTAGPGADPDDVDRGLELIDEHGSVRAAIKATHPDHGGDADDFRAVMAASS